MSQPASGGSGSGSGRGSGRGRTLGTRMVGVASLDQKVFADIDDDPFAQYQAVQIVLLSAVSSLIGLTVGGPGLGLAAAIVIGVRWWAMTRIITRMGERWLPNHAKPVTRGRAARLTGFAHAPLFLALFFPIPIVGMILWVVINAWSIASMNVAIKQLLPGVEIGRYAWLLGAAALPQIVLLFLA